jgi:hypothetical protein
MARCVKEDVFQSPLPRNVNKLNNKITEAIIGGIYEYIEIFYLKHGKMPVPWRCTKVMGIELYALVLGTVLSPVM